MTRYGSGMEIAVVLIIGGLLFLNGANNQKDRETVTPQVMEPEPIRSSSGGGGGGSGGSSSAVTSITDISICKDMTTDATCDKGIYPDSTTAYLFWRVENGVGCCNTYACNYEVFKVACLYPEFKLYTVALDGELKDVNFEEYEYSCSTDTPWNWFKLTNLTEGTHTATVVQRDCHIDKANRSIMFNITQVNGVYILDQVII
jgi:hypothetical protein